MDLKQLLAREQRAYLRRDRHAWSEHLALAQGFFGEALRQADPTRPVLILGAGTGLEIPWLLAPRATTGWDGDPWSRLGTLLRHGRFPSWEFDDFTGAFQALQATLQRSLTCPGSGRRRAPDLAIRRLAGLLPSLRPDAAPLRAWIQRHDPGTILVANVLGQLGCVAERLVETGFAPAFPWVQDPALPDPLAQALDAWTARGLQAVCQVLAESGAALWLLHDRAAIHGEGPVELGPQEEAWARQLKGQTSLEVSDPLLGLDLRQAFQGRRETHWKRWLWPVGPAQTLLMEALAFGPSARPGSGGVQTV